MKHRWAALCLVLTLSALVPRALVAQGSGPSGSDRATVGRLRQNYPNPFNPETRIPFDVGLDENGACRDPSRQYRVSLKVYNVLVQLVAVPVLQGGTGAVPGGQSLEEVVLTCGRYTAYWDGKYLNTSREVASGVYIIRLLVDGQPSIRKTTVAK